MPFPSGQDIATALAQHFHIDTAGLIQKSVQILIIWTLAWIGYRLIRLAARRIEVVVDDGDPTITTLREKRGQTLAQLLRTVGRAVVIIVAGLLTLDLFIEIGPLLAGAGILGLAVSFGAQSLVKDILSGFFILLEDQFAIGDIIEAGGKGGVVEKMTLRVVVLRDLEGVRHVIPNSEIRVVSNRTRGWARAVVDVGVAYGTDVDRALAVVRDEVAGFAADPAWHQKFDGAPDVVGVESLADSAVLIRVLLRTQPGNQWEVGREFRRRVKKRLDAEGIEIPFPQRKVHVQVEGGEIRADTAAAVAGGAAGA